MLSLLEPAVAKDKLESVRKKDADQRPVEGLSRAEYFLMLTSSFIFGVAHYFGGWEPGKIVSVFVISMIFGYSYYTYGIKASIMLHWFLNYYFAVYYYTSSYFPILGYVHEMVFFLHIFGGVILWAILITIMFLATAH